jgi:formamidopyrimidine-DNA glycosylase
MPELPEVEVVRRQLEKITADHPSIREFQFKRKDLRDPMPMAHFKKMQGAQILSIRRRAKYLLIETSKGGILSHLGMTGSWRVAKSGDEQLHDHIYLHLSSGLRLAFRDPRRFGIFETFDILHQNQNKRLKDLGPEPLEEAFTAEKLLEKLKNKNVSLKVALMDQKVVVGVGNIYASEALFQAQISPKLISRKLKLEKAERLVSAIKSILEKAIEAGGSSISDFKDAENSSGYFQNQHFVYDRFGLPCAICRSKIKTLRMAGRSTFWCPRCQSS